MSLNLCLTGAGFAQVYKVMKGLCQLRHFTHLEDKKVKWYRSMMAFLSSANESGETKEGPKVRLKKRDRGRGGGGQVVSVYAFNSNDPSSNPADAYIFFCKIFV